MIENLLYAHLDDPAAVRYRQAVFADLEDPTLRARLQQSLDHLRTVRTHLSQLQDMPHPHQREGWFLDATSIYCDAVRSLADDLCSSQLDSKALRSFRSFVTSYVAATTFNSLAAEADEQRSALGGIRYCLRVHGSTVRVSRYQSQADYSREIAQTFERFKQGGVRSRLIDYRAGPGMNHIAAQILQLVARLFPDEFSALDEYCRRHAGFYDETLRRFEREVQFYLAYLAYIEPLRATNLPFCYPEVSATSKEVFATDTFDLALGAKLVSEGNTVVCNEFHLAAPERIFVVSGPNQGGKTTFARTFGQLHHLASVGCPVPGSAARLFLFDRLFVHFGREEDPTNQRGKLEDDLVRIRQVLQAATPRSIMVLNEVFSSTTLQDARFLGSKALQKIIELDLLCVYVTFVDELAKLGETVVSVASTVVTGNPSERTYKIVRKPPDGLAYAEVIAEAYGLTYASLRRRLAA
ncbi:MAG: MutS-related protein [Candidatus Dormibacteria bacterium]